MTSTFMRYFISSVTSGLNGKLQISMSFELLQQYTIEYLKCAKLLSGVKKFNLKRKM